MDSTLIDDRRIHEDFSQSVSKLWNQYRHGKGNHPKGGGCFKCGATDHIARDCEQASNGKQQGTKDVLKTIRPSMVEMIVGGMTLCSMKTSKTTMENNEQREGRMIIEDLRIQPTETLSMMMRKIEAAVERMKGRSKEVKPMTDITIRTNLKRDLMAENIEIIEESLGVIVMGQMTERMAGSMRAMIKMKEVIEGDMGNAIVMKGIIGGSMRAVIMKTRIIDGGLVISIGGRTIVKGRAEPGMIMSTERNHRDERRR